MAAGNKVDKSDVMKLNQMFNMSSMEQWAVMCSARRPTPVSSTSALVKNEHVLLVWETGAARENPFRHGRHAALTEGTGKASHCNLAPLLWDISALSHRDATITSSFLRP